MLDPTFPSVYYFGIFSKAHIIKINKNNLPLKILYPLLIKERAMVDNRKAEESAVWWMRPLAQLLKAVAFHASFSAGD